MSSTIDHIAVTYIGGPTVRLDVSGIRFLTDPTFDAGNTVYESATSTLTKLRGPALDPASVGPVDAVLLSHDHHFDNLDRAGRTFLASRTVFTTPLGAGRLGGAAVGLEPWQTRELESPEGGVLRVTGTPARHGPRGGDRGPVTGFVLGTGESDPALYVSGDTVWYEGVAEVVHRFNVRVAVLFMGAARVAASGGAAVTMTAADGVEFARACPLATIVPVHVEDWAHFTEHREIIQHAFDASGLAQRLRWPLRGSTITVAMHDQTAQPR